MENEFMILKRNRKYLTSSQYKLLKGQLIAGDKKGAMKGLYKIINRHHN